MRVDNCVKDLSRKIGRSPSVAEVGAALNLQQEEVLEAMEAASAYDAVSLESYRFGDEGDGETYAESIGVEDDRFELVEYGATIAPTLQALPARDRIVLHLRFVEDLTQAEIASSTCSCVRSSISPISATEGERPRRRDSSLTALSTRMTRSCIPRGTWTAQPLSRK